MIRVRLQPVIHMGIQLQQCIHSNGVKTEAERAAFAMRLDLDLGCWGRGGEERIGSQAGSRSFAGFGRKTRLSFSSLARPGMGQALPLRD
jgi:hypothetical protein